MRRAVAALGATALMLLSTGGATAESPRPNTETAPLVRIPFPRDDGSLTPYTFGIGYPLVTLVYDTLLWHNADGIPRPWLARSMETSPDGTVLTIHLVDGVRWQDGVALTARDVAFTFGYVAAHPHPRFSPELAEVTGAEASDATTVVVHLRRPAPGLVEGALSDLPILPQHLWEPLPAGTVAPEGLAVGSGPYRLTAHRPGEGYRFEANPDYFRGAPAVAAIEAPLIPDAEGAIRALKHNDADLIPVSAAGRANARPRGLGIGLLRGESYAGIRLVLNVRRAPFDRVEVRRAVAQALDLPRLTTAVGDGVSAEHGYVHPASPWAARERLQHFDETAARRALAGFDIPPLQVLTADDDPVQREAGRQVSLALQRAGLQADVQPVARDDLARATGGATPDFQLAIGTSTAAASTDPNELSVLFGPGSTAAGLNPSGYSSPEFDALADRVATTPDPAARRAAVGDTLRLLAADVPVIPLLFPTGLYAYRPALYDGWVFVKGSGVLDKLSFVEPRARRGGAGGAGHPQTVSADYTFGWIALGLIAVAVVLGGADLVRRRRA